MSQTKAQLIDNLVSPITGALGSAAAPTFSFTADPNTGLYSPGADQVAISTGGSGRLFVDASGNVGVGAIPSQSLHVTSTSNGTTARFQNNSGNFIDFYETTGGTRLGYLGSLDNTNWTVHNDKNGYLAFDTNNSERLRITSAGLVGVGTSSPRVNVHIFGTASNAPTLGVASGSLIVGPGDRDYGLAMGTAAAGYSWIQSQNFVSAGAAYSLLLQPSGGNVGIGTTSPQSFVTINGGTGAGFTDVLQLSAGAAAANSGPGLSFNINYGSYDVYKTWQTGLIRSAAENTSNYHGYLAFYTNSGANATNISEKARIDSSGRLGIGTSSVLSNVQIVVDSAVADNGSIFTLASGGGNLVNKLNMGVSSANNYAFIQSVKPGTDVLPLLLNPSGGRVGIGTTSPVNKLDVNGSISASGAFINTGFAPHVHIGLSGGNPCIASGNNVAATFLPLVFRQETTTGASEAMRIDPSGRLGIGTSSANKLLQVGDRTGATNGCIEIANENGSNPNDYTFLQFAQSGNPVALSFSTYRYVSGGNWYNDLRFNTGAAGSSSTKMTLTAGGSLGIGTTAASSLLHVYQPTGSDAFEIIEAQSSGNNAGLLVKTGGNNLGYFTGAGAFAGTATNLAISAPSGGIEFRNGASNTERARIDSSGRLGIGTSTFSDNVLLSLKANIATITPGILFEDSGASGRKYGIYSGGGTFSFRDFTAGQDRLVIDSSGQTTATIGTSGGSYYVFSTVGNGTNCFRVKDNGQIYMGLASTSPYNATTVAAANANLDSNGFFYRSTSSIKYKTDVETLGDSYADAILDCRPVWYRSTTGNDNPEWGYWGFIAEEVAEIDPRLVSWKTHKLQKHDDGTEDVIELETPEPEGVQYDRFVPHLLNLIRRQQQAIETLEAKVTALESQ
jgi:hypothetical protein